jgi:hypothetical protein
VITNATKFFGVFLAALAIGASGLLVNARGKRHEQNHPTRIESRSELVSPRPGEAGESLPLRFVPIHKSDGARPEFLARGVAHEVSLKSGAALLELKPSTSSQSRKSHRSEKVRVALAGSNAPSRGFAENGYERVRFDGVYPGIDLVYHGNQNELEYDFLVAAHADSRKIIVKLDGIDGMRLDAEGNIVLRAGQREIVQHKPFVYQEVNGMRREVESGFVLLGSNQVGFELSTYDKNRGLVIDPVLTYDGR